MREYYCAHWDTSVENENSIEDNTGLGLDGTDLDANEIAITFASKPRPMERNFRYLVTPFVIKCHKELLLSLLVWLRVSVGM
mmetsp:Transcript_2555/g.3468  ORF Transcript_2555/g.3468 Transcript_2555/m.3468 type:complete len:82 (+) Transcript_2555:331-576(+)